jgi:dienelactone hydrolase
VSAMKAPRTVISTALTLAAITHASASFAATDFGAKGPEATTTSNLPAGAATGGKLVVPNGAGPYPILVASHGFSASSANQLGWAEHFASYGFVVAVPDFPGGLSPDHVKNGDTIVTLVNDVATAVPKADKTRIGFEGHSAGGLATTLAAAKVKPGAVVLFDPVDNGGRGKTAFATLCSPTLVLFANAGTCNNSAGWKAFGAATTGPLTLASVVGGSHCDGENASRGVACSLFCQQSGADPARQTVHAKYATAHFMAVLKNDADAKALLADTALAGDTALSDTSVKAGAPCSGTTPGSDAGPTTDGGSTPTPTPTGTTPGTPGTPGTPNNPGGSPSAQPEDGAATESGCSAGPGAASGSIGAVALGLAVGLVAVGRARRRTR